MRVVKNKFYDEYLETQSRNYNEKREKNLIDKYGEVDGIMIIILVFTITNNSE